MPATPSPAPLVGRRPFDYAFLIAVGYLALGWIYIAFSGDLARKLAPNKETLALIEQVKGSGYVAVSAVLLLVFSYLLFRRLARVAERELALQETLLVSERRAMAGVLSLSVVHDCNNLLTVTSSAIQLLQEEADRLSPEGRQVLAQLRDALMRLDELSHRMRTAGARATAGQLRAVKLDEFLAELVNLVRHHAKVKWCNVRLEAGDATILAVHPGLLQDALLNLMVNAADATEERGDILVRLREHDGDVAIEVHDNGPGVPPEQRERVFDGYVTTKSDGSGLGLLSVSTCARLHGGAAELDASPLGGALFRIRLPKRGAPALVA